MHLLIMCVTNFSLLHLMKAYSNANHNFFLVFILGEMLSSPDEGKWCDDDDFRLHHRSVFL